jgi:hypothetical protein
MRGKNGEDEIAAAERFGSKRWMVVILFTLAFVALGSSWVLQVDYFDRPIPGRSDGLRGLAWAAWGIVVLAATFWPRWGRGSARQRRILNDELTRAHRAAARTAGFWLLLLGVAGLFAVQFFEPVNFPLALMVIVTAGIAFPALVFSALQRRAEADG